MDSIIVRGHKSLSALLGFGPVSGTFHKVNGRDGLLFAHGGKFFELPEANLESEIESEDEDESEDSSESSSSLPLAKK